MNDFLGSFASGPGELARAFLFPATVAIALWFLFVLDHIGEGAGTPIHSIGGSDLGRQLIYLGGAALVLSLVLGIITPSVNRLLQGYWPRRHKDGLAAWIWDNRRQKWHADRKEVIQAINALLKLQALTAPQLAALSRNYALLKRYPEYPCTVMPTRLGNVLKQSQKYAKLRFGIDLDSSWDSLLSVVPDNMREVHALRRTQMDLWISVVVLSGVFTVATWAIQILSDLTWQRAFTVTLICIVVGLGSYRAAVAAAETFADHTIAVVQLGRVPLAEALGMELPPTIEGEKQLWDSFSGHSFWGDDYPGAQTWLRTLALTRRHRRTKP